MMAGLASALAASLFAAQPAGALSAYVAQLPAPMRFEVSRGGRVIWRGDLVFRRAEPPFEIEARGVFTGLCAAREGDSADNPGNRLGLHVALPRLTPSWLGGTEYQYQFGWSRPYDQDPLRLDACGDRREGSASSGRNGFFLLGRRGRVVIPLPDDLVLTLRR